MIFTVGHGVKPKTINGNLWFLVLYVTVRTMQMKCKTIGLLGTGPDKTNNTVIIHLLPVVILKSIACGYTIYQHISTEVHNQKQKRTIILDYTVLSQ